MAIDHKQMWQPLYMCSDSCRGRTSLRRPGPSGALPSPCSGVEAIACGPQLGILRKRVGEGRIASSALEALFSHWLRSTTCSRLLQLAYVCGFRGRASQGIVYISTCPSSLDVIYFFFLWGYGHVLEHPVDGCRAPSLFPPSAGGGGRGHTTSLKAESAR